MSTTIARAHKPGVRLTVDQQCLAASYMPLVRKISRRYRDSWPGRARDIESEAVLGLIDAVLAYDPDHGVKFGTWAAAKIGWRVRDYLRRVNRDRAPYPDMVGRTLHHIPRKHRGYQDLNSGSLLSYEPPVAKFPDAVDQVEHWLSILPAAHARVLRAVYLEEVSQTELARRQHIAKSHICRLHAEGLAMLRATSPVLTEALSRGIS